MDDLQICKRIAEIEGHKELADFDGNLTVFIKTKDNMSTINSYNPLVDDGLCFRLMIKHEIKVSTYYKIGDRVPFYGAETPDLEEVEARTPHKCVCLAIMSAYD